MFKYIDLEILDRLLFLLFHTNQDLYLPHLKHFDLNSNLQIIIAYPYLLTSLIQMLLYYDLQNLPKVINILNNKQDVTVLHPIY